MTDLERPLASLLWAAGPGSENLRPMVVPVSGGLLVADEFIDLLPPVHFHRTRLRRPASRARPPAAAEPPEPRGRRIVMEGHAV